MTQSTHPADESKAGAGIDASAPAEPVMPEPCAYRFDGMEGTATTIWHYSTDKPQVTEFTVHPLCAIEAARTYAESLAAAMVAQYKADAERYQWLRGRVPGSAYRIMGVIYSEGGAGVDAAIDTARAATGEKT